MGVWGEGRCSKFKRDTYVKGTLSQLTGILWVGGSPEASNPPFSPQLKARRRCLWSGRSSGIGCEPERCDSALGSWTHSRGNGKLCDEGVAIDEVLLPHPAPHNYSQLDEHTSKSLHVRKTIPRKRDMTPEA